MEEFISNLASNNYVIYGLSALLGLLIILFFVVLFSGKKKGTKKVDKVEENIENVTKSEDLNFDHGEYVKETTAEFELAPIADIKPTPDTFVPEVNVEESPTHDIEEKNVEDVPLANFNFDDLSKSISEELDKLKTEEEGESFTSQIPVVEEKEEVKEETSNESFMDTFKEESEFKPIEINTISDLGLNPSEKEENINNDNPFITEPVKETNEPVKEVNEPVLKDEEVPLFARFNQETYDINKKD